MSKKEKNKKTSKKRNKSRFNKKTLGIVATVLAVVAGVILGILIYNNTRYSKFTKITPKEQVREEVLGYAGEIENPRVLSNPLRVGENFAVNDIVKDGERVAMEVIVTLDNPDAAKSEKIPPNASILLLVDNDLKIQGVKPFNPTFFTLGIDFEKFFEDFKGKDALQFINNVDGIYTDESGTALIVKNKIKAAMSLLYIEKFGEGEYDKIAGNDFVFAEKGAKVTPVKATDINGQEVDLEKFKDYKLFIVGGNPGCGGCVDSIRSLSKEIAKYNTNDVKFIVLSFSPDKEEALKLSESLPGEKYTILDPDRTLAIELKVNSSPYIALVDKGLILFYRGPGEPMLETITQIKNFLEES